MLHPADKHSKNGIPRNILYSRAKDSSLRISVHSYLKPLRMPICAIVYQSSSNSSVLFTFPHCFQFFSRHFCCSANFYLFVCLPVIIQHCRQAIGLVYSKHSITKRKERQFYQNYRSFMEKVLRFDRKTLRGVHRG